jgi:hypothetical protein
LFEIRPHVGKNRLYVTLTGTLSEAEAREFTLQAAEAVDRLRRGFVTIAVISSLDPLSPEAIDQLKPFVKDCVGRGERQAIRVVGKSTQAAVQFEKLGKHSGQSAHLAFSLEEAERMLDGDLS